MPTRALLRSTLVAAIVARHRHRASSSSFRTITSNSRAAFFGNNNNNAQGRRRRRRQTMMHSSSFSDDDATNAVTSDNNNNEEKKRSLRAKIKSRLKTHCSREEELRDSEVICEKIMGMRAYREAKTMCVYIAHPKLHEVDCSTLIREALSSSSSSTSERRKEEEKKVYVPIVDDRNSNVRFLRIRDLEKDLEKRTMGIMEPTETDWRTNERREDLADLKDDERLDLVITPGLAFDETCKRLGRGGGYYDKFLREGKGREAVKIGLAYDAQIVDGEAEDEAIPLDPWDVVLDVVVSKSRDFYREKVDGE